MIENLPNIRLNKITHIIDRVCQRYPTISKVDIILIVSSLLNVIRQLWMDDKVVSISGLFNHAYVLRYIRNGKAFVRMKLETPKSMKL